MTDREAMQQAIALICSARLCEINSMSSRQEMLRLMIEATDILRAALAEPEPEPVAWALAAELRWLHAECDALRAALKDIADDYEDRFDMNDPSTNPGIKHVVREARAALKEVK